MLEKQTVGRTKSGSPLTIVACSECKESVDSSSLRAFSWFPHRPNCSLYQPPSRESDCAAGGSGRLPVQNDSAGFGGSDK